MKRLNCILMLLATISVLLTACNKDDDEIIITTDFDTDFAKLLQEKGYIMDATHITLQEIKRIYGLNIMGAFEDHEAGKGLTSLKGIEYFENLTDLYCDNHYLTNLDVSKNTKLTHLSCYHNQLTTLDISKNMELTKLDCCWNHLTSLDVSKNMELTRLDCRGNQLTTLDVSKNTKLADLSCYDNHLTTLDISKNMELTRLDCGWNQLTSLDVSKNTKLADLSCNSNQLTTLDISKNMELIRLDCCRNHLTSLDVSKNTGLTILYCDHNPGNGKTFPVTFWKGYEGTLIDDYSTFWRYDDQIIAIDIQVVE